MQISQHTGNPPPVSSTSRSTTTNINKEHQQSQVTAPPPPPPPPLPAKPRHLLATAAVADVDSQPIAAVPVGSPLRSRPSRANLPADPGTTGGPFDFYPPPATAPSTTRFSLGPLAQLSNRLLKRRRHKKHPMLAIQRPRMGSSQPPDGNNPFGYTFTPDDNPFLAPLPPPEPAPGQPLLSTEDDRALTNFFDQLTANQYSDMSFGEGLNFSDAWQGLPPVFMGTVTSYGHQPAHSMGSSFLEYPDPSFNDVFSFASNTMAPPPQQPHPPPPPQRQPPQPPLHTPVEQSTPADAAAVLTSLHHGLPRQAPNVSHAPLLPSQSMGPPLPSHSVNQNRGHFKPEHTSPVRATPAALGSASTSIPNLSEQRNDHLFTEMAFGNPHSQSSHRAAQLPEDVRWGSDTSFGRGRSFMPPSERETVSALESQRIKYIECLKLSSSASNTRPSSPVANRDAANGQLIGHDQKEPEIPAPKKMQSKAAEGADEEGEESLPTPAKAATAKKRKSNMDLGKGEDVTAVNDTPGKRRKSNATGTKPPRENLTEEQKRSNHIRSEQKRRTLIKEGFDDLQEIVPSLKNGSYSKSAMLQIAGEWLEEILKENEQLSS